MKKTLLFVTVFMFSAFLFYPVLATELEKDEDYNTRITNLELLHKSISQVSKDIENLQGALQGPNGTGREDELKQRINELILKQKELVGNFNQLVTEVDPGVFVTEKDKKLDLNKVLKELLNPLIREVKDVTSRPRMIENLRSSIELYQSQLQVTDKAIYNIDSLLPHSKKSLLTKEINKIKDVWENRRNEIQTRLNIATQQLELKTRYKKSMAQSIQEVLRVFFKNRGRNLFLAFLAFLVTWFSLLRIHRLIQHLSPLHGDDRSFYIRIFDILYVVMTVVLSVLAIFAVLYFFGDWVLISVSIIFIIGFGWASKHAIPKFWSQAKLILNFGTVREKEMVIYNGIPYRVESINLLTELVNNKLDNHHIRLPLKDLMDLRSRPISENEPMFPSESGDWVLLNNTFGKVTAQTPETVRIELRGGASAHYLTIDYLSQSPVNLSSGFRLRLTFSLDHSHRSAITNEIPGVLEKEISSGLFEKGYENLFTEIKIEFKDVGLSSLDIEVIVDFTGEAAPEYNALHRVIRQICIDTACTCNWQLPYQQVRFHVGNDVSIPPES
jgi:hypothetical protein